MIEYKLEGKIDPRLFDLMLFDIDNKVEIKITCGAGISNNDANKIAALGQPLFVRASIDEGVKSTIENLMNNSADYVLIELPVSAMGLSMGNVYGFISCYNEDKSFNGTSICLIDAQSTPYLVTDDQWNNLIVHCLDHDIQLCWSYDAAGARYTNYLRSIV